MCNCITETSDRVKKMLAVDNGMVDFELFSSRTYTTFRYRNEKDKERTQMLLNSHCPFCGKKYDEVE